MRTYTKEEVAKHNGEDGSCWVIIDEHVHDLTSFLEEHPGGEEVLMSSAGSDGTDCFNEIGHSEDAKRLCLKYRIGVIGEHPGGEEVLLEQSGQDATEAFEDVGHSSDARELMGQYKIGELVEEERVKTEKKNPYWASSSDPSNKDSSWNPWVAAIVIGLIAIAIYTYYPAK